VEKDPESFLEDIRSQILAHQDVFFSEDLIKSRKTVQMGDYRLPGQLSPFFKCWGDSNYQEKSPYHMTHHRCSTDDHIFISAEHSSGIMSFSHRYISRSGMNNFRFNNLYSDFFKEWKHDMGGNEEEVTRFECKSATLRHGGLTFKTAFCARGYRKLKDLYDVVLKAAVLASEDSGLETELQICGVSFEKAVDLTRGYLEMITWGK
jgi:hypothetical protein